MIILRQKIFFDPSKYNPEDLAKIQADRHAQAVKLMELRKQAQGRHDFNVGFSQKVTDAKIKQAEGMGLGQRNTGLMRQSLTTQHQKNVNQSFQARNATYKQALDESAKFRNDLDKKYKKAAILPGATNPNNNPYNTSILGNTYKKPAAAIAQTKTTPTTPTTPQQPTEKKGIGTGGKLAIAAAGATATYLAARALRNKIRDRREETRENRRNRKLQNQ